MARRRIRRRSASLGVVLFVVAALTVSSPVSLITGGAGGMALAAPAPLTSRISVSSSGTQGDDHSNAEFNAEAVSADGRHVVFHSIAGNLVGGDTNANNDVFVRDLTTSQTTRVSVSSSGTQANGGSESATITPDGRYVAFVSWATNLVAGDTNGGADVFVHDRTTGTTDRVSVGSSGQGNTGVYPSTPSITPDGRFVAFCSGASNLVSGDTNGYEDVFVRDRTTGTTTRESVSSEELQAQTGGCTYLSISNAGRYVAFDSTADNLVAGDTNLFSDVFVRDRTLGETVRVSVNDSGAQGGNSSAVPSISDDGRYVAFYSRASNLVSGDTNGRYDVFVHDRVASRTTRVSTDSSGIQGNLESDSPAISEDGRYVAFASQASNLVSGDTNGANDVFVHDRTTGRTIRASVDHLGNQAGGASVYPSISPEGRYVAFSSHASNLVPQDTNFRTDVFLHDRVAAALDLRTEQTWGGCGGSIHAPNPTTCQSDPVNSATGAFVNSVIDVVLPGIGPPFELTRSYTSADTATGPLGPGWTHNYAAGLTVQGNEATFKAEDGQRILFTQVGGSYVGPPGARSRLTDVGGAYELLRPDQIVYRFDSQGRLTEIKDRNNRQLSLTYDSSGQLQTVTDTVGRAITFTHNPSNLLTGISLPDGRSVAYGYTSGRLTSVTDVRGKSTTYSYDGSGRLSEIVDPNGHSVIRNTYGGDGRVTEQLDALGNRSTFAWDPATQTSTLTDAKGKTWKDVYQGNVHMQRIDHLGNKVSFDYDAELNLVRVTDARGNATMMTYDASGNMLSRKAPAPLSYRETFTYNARNDLTSSTDGRGNTTNYGYDASGNLTGITRPGNNLTQFGRDPGGTGLMTSLTDPRGKTTTFEYDAQGNLTKTTTPLGNVTTMGYDARGRMASLVEPRGNVQGANPNDYRWTYTYDAADNLLTRNDPLGNQTAWAYDNAGKLSSTTDAKGRTTTYGYNAADELTSVTAPGNSVTSYAYDEVGNLIRRTDAKNHVTTYGYDPVRRLTSVTSPTNQLWTYEYDPSGNPIKLITALGNGTPDPSDGQVTYDYDALNRVAGLNYSDATPDVTFSYDPNSNRTQMADGAGTETYTWDALDRLTQVTRGADSFSYAYDPADNLTRRTYPDSTVVDYTYDDDGRLSTVSSGGATSSYGYDPAANLTSTTLPSSNGHVETRTYDRAGRLTEVKNAQGGVVLSRFSYTLDAGGNPNTVAGTEGVRTYAYDQLDRLTEVCFAAACPGPLDPFIRYIYDPVGNRTTEARPTGTTTYAYNDADQLTSETSPTGTITYDYDSNGNQTRKGTRTFSYDLANRLTSTTSSSTTIAYTYDGDGKRLEASSGPSPQDKTKYLWDPNHPLYQLALERDGAGALRRRYILGNDLVSMFAQGADHYYHYDGLGSVVNLTSALGLPEVSYSYEPFGTERPGLPPLPGAPANLMRFTGELFDEQTGLYHLRARQYDPRIGRFLTTDPLAPSLTDPHVAAYVYVGDRPTVLVDPRGLRGEMSMLEDLFTNPVDAWKSGWDSKDNPCQGVIGEVAAAFSLSDWDSKLALVKAPFVGAGIYIRQVARATGTKLGGAAGVATNVAGVATVSATGVDLGCKLGGTIRSWL